MTSIAFLSNKYRNRKQNAWQQGNLVALFYQAIFITIFMISYYFSIFIKTIHLNLPSFMKF